MGQPTIYLQKCPESMDFDSALAEAQAKGFAEKDPSSDLEGWDAAYKLAILARLAFDSAIDIDDVHREGISMVDIRYPIC